MQTDDVTLQELIVRALTGQDEDARRSIEAATAGDPELREFYSELEGLVGLLGESKDWRAGAPSPELTAKVRQAVVSKLPAAPPHFRTVVLEADLGRRRATRKLVLLIAAAAALVGAGILYWKGSVGDTARLRLNGKVAYETPLKDDSVDARQLIAAWEISSGQWVCDGVGLHADGEGDAPCAILLKKKFDAAAALALNLDIRIPSLDDQTSATVYLNDESTRLRGYDGLSLHLTSDGLIFNGPRGALLHSRPGEAAEGERFSVRIEYLGRHARLIVNGKVLFDGPLAQPLDGPLAPVIRVIGPRKNKIIFNALRIEQ